MAIPLFVYGAGGHARETLMWVRRAGLCQGEYAWQGFVVTDLRHNSAPRQSVESIVGDEAWLLGRPGPLAVVIGVGDPAARLAVANRLSARADLVFPVVVDPSVVLDRDSCTLERGTVIAAGCSLTVNIRLREFAYLSRNCTVGHESEVGAGTLVNPSVTISGYVHVGRGVMIGTGATILEDRCIGDGAVVGGGALVNRNVEPGMTVVGVPAKPIARKTAPSA